MHKKIKSIEEVIEELLSKDKHLFEQLYWFQQEFSVRPKKEHFVTTIKQIDIINRRSGFLQELVCTIIDWVYGDKKAEAIIKKSIEVDKRTSINAHSQLQFQAYNKFRPGFPQGQFGELILFNFLQYFFKAAPLLRKQRITTSNKFERFGADAIHYKREESKDIFILGESKCFQTRNRFKTVFRIALESIMTTLNNFEKEINLYLYDDFIEPELQEIADKFKSNKLVNLRFELVCLIIYNENMIIKGSLEDEIKESTKRIMQTRCESLDNKIYEKFQKDRIERVNYIFFPIWELDKLLVEFQTYIGTNT